MIHLLSFPYEYTVEMMNKFRRLELVNTVPKELRTGVRNTAQKATNKHPPPKKKKRKTAKWLSEEALQIAEEKRSKKHGRKGKVHPTKCTVPENSKERQEGLLQ